MRFAFNFPIAAGVVVSMTALSVALGGCSAEDAVCRDYSPPTSFDAQNPKVSFANDVMPIFNESCSFTSCHGSPTGTANGVFLGGTDPGRVHKAIVDVRANELPTMAFVKAGDPRESFLLRKMDGSQCVHSAQCTGNDCGESMPRNGELLPVAVRDTVRRWIAQGAKND